MRWPFWFPYPGAYAHCLLMLVLNAINAAILSPVVWVIFVVGGAASIAAEAFAGNATLSALLLFGVILAIATLPLLLLAYEYQLLDYLLKWAGREKTTPPVYAIPPEKYWRDAVFGYLVFAGCILVMFSSWLIWRCYFGYCQDAFLEEEAYIITGSALVLMVFCHHLRLLRQEWRKRQNVKRNKTSLPQVKRPSRSPKSTSRRAPTVFAQLDELSVDDELELLKRRMGKSKGNGNSSSSRNRKPNNP
ncbi:MAG: hypothetical protein ACPGVO_14400 [Spirulinaceae cyanobacterium]